MTEKQDSGGQRSSQTLAPRSDQIGGAVLSTTTPRKPRLGRAVLESLADPLQKAIVALTGSELRAARAELSELSTTNCGWFLYACRVLLREQIDDWLIQRLDSTRCSECKAPAHVHSDGIWGGAPFVVCTKCGVRRLAAADEMQSLHAAADRKWCARQ